MPLSRDDAIALGLAIILGEKKKIFTPTEKEMGQGMDWPKRTFTHKLNE